MRARSRIALAAMMLAGVASIAAAQPPAVNSEGGLAHDYLGPLRAQSCPTGVASAKSEVVSLSATPVPMQGVNPSNKMVGALTFVAGFSLKSSDKRFGGLSGIDLLEDGNLVTVSDQGDFVWLDLGEDGITPKGARIASLRGADGDALRGKANADAEGLAYQDGLALVSFERNHRVLAYDLEACGASARGAPINFGRFGGDLAADFARQKLTVDDNSGVEGLAITPDWFLFAGLETRRGYASPLSARAIESSPAFEQSIGNGMPPVVGLDVLPDGDDIRVFSLHRATKPFSSDAITITETRFKRGLEQANLPARITSDIAERSHVRFYASPPTVLARMNVFMTIDNFEGIAAKAMPDGRVRLYVISDDNFSKKQRTLLMIYDVPKPG